MIYLTNSYTNAVNKNNNSMGFDLFGIGSAISGIAGALGTVKASKNNLKALRETNAANLALARELNDWNLAQWNRENEYNTPVAKLNRLEAAGLNPLFYGLDGVSTAPHLESASLANLVAPLVDAGAIGSSLSHLTDSVISAGQYHLARRALDLEERKINIEEKRLGIENELKDQKKKESDKLIEKMSSEIEKMAADKGFTELQTENAKKQFELLEAERLKLLEEYEGLKLDNKLKEVFLNLYAELLAAELDIKKNLAYELALAAYNYLTSGDYNKALLYGLDLENKLVEEFGYYERVGGLVQKGASFLTPFLRRLKILRGSKVVKGAAKVIKDVSETYKKLKEGALKGGFRTSTRNP